MKGNSSFNPESLKNKLKSGQRIYGTCVTVSSPRWPALVASAAPDFVFIDTEHIPIDRSELAKMCLSYRSLGISPIVRIPQPDPHRASQAVDDGAVGVIAPYLENTDQIKKLVGATKYRPLKGEKLASILQGREKVSPQLSSYLGQYNRGVLCIANIESLPALERLDDLLTVPGLDGVFIGPHDLSVNMGIPEEYDHPDFVAAVKNIIQKAREHTLGVGIHLSLEPDRQLFWLDEGANIIIHSSDMALFSRQWQADMAHIKAAAGDDQSEAASLANTTI